MGTKMGEREMSMTCGFQHSVFFIPRTMKGTRRHLEKDLEPWRIIEDVQSQRGGPNQVNLGCNSESRTSLY
uniref:Uncharacterized protein n=1 Tax=Oryza sativa subsp. japonica TaxID=39947 RepID=Q6YWB3_ORYSJ|nr:hypothetical protein [Oryza sativa Japonica Group]BAD17573.1 hypothetical protein [Oryza sativa Japonica Group]